MPIINMMKAHKWILSLSMTLMVSCSNNDNSTIDSTLQVKATSILENKLSELNALSGQAIVMEVQTGHIKAMIGLEKKDSANYQLVRTSPKHTNQH